MVFDKVGYDEDGKLCQINSETGESKDLPEWSEEQERLQELWDSQRTEDNYGFTIYYTDDDYWYAIPLEARHFYDEGEYLGNGVKEAEETLRGWLR
jgi:hypothetical protein